VCACFVRNLVLFKSFLIADSNYEIVLNYMSLLNVDVAFTGMPNFAKLGGGSEFSRHARTNTYAVLAFWLPAPVKYDPFSVVCGPVVVYYF